MEIEIVSPAGGNDEALGRISHPPHADGDVPMKRKGIYNVYRAHKVPHRSQMISEKAWRAAMWKPYAGGASSRHTPAAVKIPPVGTWRIDDTFKGMHGRMISQLVSFKPSALTPQEVMVERNEEGRGDDARRYMEWWAKGNEPPPISVIQSEGGDLRITDGHRRYFAAKLLRKPVKAWVSWTVPSPSMKEPGWRPEIFMGTGLTYEIAEAEGWIVGGRRNRRRKR